MNRKTAAVLVLVMTFLLGGLGGVTAHYLYRNFSTSAPARTNQAARPPGDIAEDMAKALKLDADQKQELKRIFEQSRERYRALSQQFRPQYEALRNETNGQIRQILHGEQIALYDQFLKEARNRHRDQESAPKGRGQEPKPPPLPHPPPGTRD